jgi:threonine dehydratase
VTAAPLSDLDAPVTVADIGAAAERLSGVLSVSPVIEDPDLNKLVGRRVLLKVESLMPSGSFKIRGALNRLLQLSEADKAAGVVAFSSGNHGQGVALAAEWLGLSATIVMPADAPRVKIAGVEKAGAKVVFYDRLGEDREAIAKRIARDQGSTVVPAFDDPMIIAGAGTVGLELAEFARTNGIELGMAAAPCSGGGLIAGTGLALRAVFPNIRLFAVEPEGYDDTARSLEAGRRITLETFPPSRCDALMVNRPGELTFALNRQQLNGAVVVNDAQVEQAMAFAQGLDLILEPSGAAALAALMAGKLPPGGDPVAIILSGGNLDV